MTWNGWIIYQKADAMKNADYIDWFINEAAKAQVHLQLIYREDLFISLNKESILHKGKNIQTPHFAVIRTMEPLVNQLLESHQIRCFNSSIVSSLANDKVNTYIYAQSLAVEFPETYPFPAYSIPDKAPLPYPFVMKPRTGKGGKNVAYITCKEDYQEVASQISEEPYVMQSANVQLGKDLRVFVVGNKIITAILRENTADFRANYTLGGQASIYSLTKEEEELIHRLIDQHSFDFIGIDFLLDKQNRLIFNEIEDVVGSRMVSHLTNINIIALYVAHIKKTLEENGEQEKDEA